MFAQRMVCEFVARRGYREGWTAEEFLARNIAKLQEELAEASEHVPVSTLNDALRTVGDFARFVFDNHDKRLWAVGEIPAEDLKALRSELADCQVVLFCLAGAVGDIEDERFDVVSAALSKAIADWKRGVRNGKESEEKRRD